MKAWSNKETANFLKKTLQEACGANLSWGEQPCSPTFNLLDTHIKTRTNNPTFVEPPIQFDNNFASPVVINILKLSNVTYRATPTILKDNLKCLWVNKNKKMKVTYDSIPCFCITRRNLMMTFEDGLIMTWRFPRFSALYMLLRASFKTLTRTIAAATYFNNHVND